MLAMMPFVAGGCAAAAAASLIPLGAEALEAVGVTTASAISGKDPIADVQEDQARCDQVAAVPPYIGQLVQTPSGQIGIRSLTLGQVGGEPQWFPMVSSPVPTLSSLQFQPALSAAYRDSDKTHFLIYAPEQPQDSTENEQLIGFLGSFEPAQGVLIVSNRSYRYAFVEKLPCFKVNP